MNNYKELANLIKVNDAIYSVEFADGHTERHQMHIHDGFPCVGSSLDFGHDVFPFFRLGGVVNVILSE